VAFGAPEEFGRIPTTPSWDVAIKFRPFSIRPKRIQPSGNLPSGSRLSLPIGVSDEIDHKASISTLKTAKIDMVAAVVYNVQLIGVGGYHSGLGLTWTDIGPNWTF